MEHKKVYKIKIGNFKVDLSVSIVILLFIIFFIYTAVDTTVRDNVWSNSDQNYTIGVIQRYQHAGKSPPWFEYSYRVKDEVFANRHSILSEIGLLSIEQRKAFVGQRYYVKYVEGDPSYSKLLMEKPVPDSVEQPPKDGWEAIP